MFGFLCGAFAPDCVGAVVGEPCDSFSNRSFSKISSSPLEDATTSYTKPGEMLGNISVNCKYCRLLWLTDMTKFNIALRPMVGRDQEGTV